VPEELRDAESVNLACFSLSRSLENLEFTVPEAEPVVRLLLRTAGRLVIDTAAAGADAAAWPNTREMAVQWLSEALAKLGYEVRARE
jgi:hypothetical protein